MSIPECLNQRVSANQRKPSYTAEHTVEKRCVIPHLQQLDSPGGISTLCCVEMWHARMTILLCVCKKCLYFKISEPDP